LKIILKNNIIMAQKRIYELTTDSTYDGDYFVMVSKAGMPEDKKMKLSVPIAAEAELRDAVCDAIIDGVGLETDGTFTGIAGSTFLKDEDFEEAALAKTVKNAIVLLDDAVTAITENTLRSATILIESTAPRRLASEPVLLLECPEGYFIDVIDAFAFIDYSGGALSCGEDTLDLVYESGGTIGTWTNGFIESGVDLIEKIKKGDNYRITSANVYLSTDTDDSNLTSTSDIYINLVYQLIAI
jgi:hypothetical protein